MKIEKSFEIEIYDEISKDDNTNYYYLLNDDLVYDLGEDKIISINEEIAKLPYIETVLGEVNGKHIEKVFIKSSDDITIVTTNCDNFVTALGGASLSILASDVPLPSFENKAELDLYFSEKILHRIVCDDIAIYIRQKLLANAFRFKIGDEWFKIVDDNLEEAEQPTQTYGSDTVYGFYVTNNGDDIEAIIEAGTVY